VNTHTHACAHFFLMISLLHGKNMRNIGPVEHLKRAYRDTVELIICIGVRRCRRCSLVYDVYTHKLFPSHVMTVCILPKLSTTFAIPGRNLCVQHKTTTSNHHEPPDEISMNKLRGMAISRSIKKCVPQPTADVQASPAHTKYRGHSSCINKLRHPVHSARRARQFSHDLYIKWSIGSACCYCAHVCVYAL
jgi:hypothetical protein